MIDSLSIIVPVYNAQSSLADQMRDLLELLPDLTPRFQVVVVDDGSTDQTLEVAHELARQYPQVTTLGTRSRQGHAAAAEAGLRQATGEIVFIQQTNRPARSCDLFRLWQMRRDEFPQTTRDHLRPLEAGLIQRLSRWGFSIWDPPSDSQPSEAFQMLRRGEIPQRTDTQRATPHRPPAHRPTAPSPQKPIRQQPTRQSTARQSTTRQSTARQVTVGSNQASSSRLNQQAADDHLLLDLSVKALYS